MNPLIHHGERLEDLNLNNLQIIQNPEAFCFGIDAVLLSWYARGACKRKTRAVDLCTGTGIIPLLLYGHTHIEKMEALEIQKDVADLARRNMLLNGLADKIIIHHADLRTAKDLFLSSSLDLITCNPPYMPVTRGMKSPSDTIAVARHELTCTIDDVARFAQVHLKDRGKLFMVHRADRVIDLAATLRSHALEIKRLRFVYPSPEKEANLILIEAMKKGQPACIVEPPLYVYNPDGTYTKEIDVIYGMN